MNSQEIAQNKARELILYMDNDQDIYNSYKMSWVNNYTKKVRKGIFNIEEGIKGMSYLMKNLQQGYNKTYGIDKEGKIPDIYIDISKDEKRTIQIELLENILYHILDNNQDLEDQTRELLKNLKGYF